MPEKVGILSAVILRILTSRAGVLRPKHIIQATGLAGKPRLPADIPGFDDFVSKNGKGIIHSTDVGNDAPAGPGEKVVVVGTGNSANDIAQACWENGAEVTMIQRGSSFVFHRDSNAKQFWEPLYSEMSVR
jgi:putative flavoprotein involved in K+ transport